MEFKDFSLEVKKVEETGSFSGLAAVYGNTDRGGDVIVRGAFREFDLTSDGQIRVLDQHKAASPIGKAKLTDTAAGLEIKGKLNLAVSYAKDTYELLRDGTLGGMSIGYDILPGGAEHKAGVRRLTAIKLWEVSVVTFPMNPLAIVSTVKSAKQCRDIREFEDLARNALGLSGRQAKRLASAAWPALQGPDSDDLDLEAILGKLTHLTNLVKGSK